MEATLRAQIKEIERVQKETEAILCAKTDKLSNENGERMKIVEAIHGEVKVLKKRANTSTEKMWKAPSAVKWCKVVQGFDGFYNI
jgi:hypothetical protein